VAELRRVGPVEAFGLVAVRERRAATTNLLYALYAALESKHWTEVTRGPRRRGCNERQGWAGSPSRDRAGAGLSACS
jgi:hypothetical protein